MTRLDLIGILIVVTVVVLFCLRLAWEHIRQLRRRSDRYEPLDGTAIRLLQMPDTLPPETIINPAATVDHAPAIGMRDRVPRPRPIMANYVSGAFAFPTRREFYDRESDRG